MKTIKIREGGDPVYFLSTTKGFVKGWIKRTFVESEYRNSTEKATYRLEYRITCPHYTDQYMGDLKDENELFDSKEEMINYYSSLKI